VSSNKKHPITGATTYAEVWRSYQREIWDTSKYGSLILCQNGDDHIIAYLFRIICYLLRVSQRRLAVCIKADIDNISLLKWWYQCYKLFRVVVSNLGSLNYVNYSNNDRDTHAFFVMYRCIMCESNSPTIS